MRKIFLLLGLLLLPGMLHAGDFRPVIKSEAEKWARAMQKGDYDRLLGFLPPQVIKRSGGRAALLRRIKAKFALAGEYGVERMDVTSGQPATPRTTGRWLTCLIPLNVVLHRPPLNVIQETHLLGLSSDQGKHWFFMISYRTSQAEFNAWLPELAGKVILPPDLPPRFEPAFF